VTVAAGDEHWPWFTMPLGLGIALLAGLVGPLLRMRTRYRIR
jgi:H+/Cl- antiporter ClcA